MAPYQWLGNIWLLIMQRYMCLNDFLNVVVVVGVLLVTAAIQH